MPDRSAPRSVADPAQGQPPGALARREILLPLHVREQDAGVADLECMIDLRSHVAVVERRRDEPRLETREVVNDQRGSIRHQRSDPITRLQPESEQALCEAATKADRAFATSSVCPQRSEPRRRDSRPGPREANRRGSPACARRSPHTASRRHHTNEANTRVGGGSDRFACPTALPTYLTLLRRDVPGRRGSAPECKHRLGPLFRQRRRDHRCRRRRRSAVPRPRRLPLLPRRPPPARSRRDRRRATRSRQPGNTTRLAGKRTTTARGRELSRPLLAGPASPRCRGQTASFLSPMTPNGASEPRAVPVCRKDLRASLYAYARASRSAHASLG